MVWSVALWREPKMRIDGHKKLVVREHNPLLLTVMIVTGLAFVIGVVASGEDSLSTLAVLAGLMTVAAAVRLLVVRSRTRDGHTSRVVSAKSFFPWLWTLTVGGGLALTIGTAIVLGIIAADERLAVASYVVGGFMLLSALSLAVAIDRAPPA
jgi:hypothetical protein